MKLKASCAECGTPLWGDNLNRRGGLYYCSADFERLSAAEKGLERRQILDHDEYKKIYDGTAETEFVTNGGFDTDSDWTKDADVNITGGEAIWANALSGTSLTQTGVVVIGVFYRVIFEISSWTNGDIRVILGGVNGRLRKSAGIFAENIRADSNRSLILRSAETATNLSVNSISVKQI